MSRVFEGQLSAAGLKFAIVVSRFNSFITDRLPGGAMDALTRAGAYPDLIHIVKVPGALDGPPPPSQAACAADSFHLGCPQAARGRRPQRLLRHAFLRGEGGA